MWTSQNKRLTPKERKPKAIIKPKVQELAQLNVLAKGMTQKEAVSTFDIVLSSSKDNQRGSQQHQNK